MLHRHLDTIIKDPLFEDKRIFIAGPRQVGKTTTAKKWLASSKAEEHYYNWDDEKVRRLFRKDAHFFESSLREKGTGTRVVFDEIHKMNKWKTLLYCNPGTQNF